MRYLLSASIAAAVGMLSASAGASGNVPLAEIESLSNGSVRCTHYDGITDDLLTAGLGKTGLAGGAPPVADPANPMPAELRRLAIYSNYRAIVDITPGGGYGTLYGPNVLADGTVTSDEGLIPGSECLTYADDGSGRKNVTLMVQIPTSFDPSHPCIVTGPSSGSRGVYGAIATSGEWGLKNGCAVAYTDKGTGVGAHDLQEDTVGLIDGVRESADLAGKASNFTARINDSERAAFNAQTPNRFAFKHAHSEQNPEADWGVDVLQAILFAFKELNRHYPKAAISPVNTIVIGSSISNGGGASVRAAEDDHFELIDGIAVSEPNVHPPRGGPFTIVQGNRRPYLGGKPLDDYPILLAIFQGCANLSQPEAPFNILPSFLNANRCASLRAKGFLTTDTLAEQAAEAQAIINGYGFLQEQNIIQPSHWASFVPQAVAVTYANTYARARVQDNLCGYSFGATDATGTPIPLAHTAEALLFATGSGIPPTAGINVINNASIDGPKQDTLSVSPSTGTLDQNLDGVLCLHSVWLGVDAITGAPLAGKLLQAHKRLRRSIDQIVMTADLKRTPAIVVAGRSDAVLPPNHTSRAYYARNQQIEGGASHLRYIEVTNAQHLDAFNALAGFDTRFVPLHYYLMQALNVMYAHLKSGAPLPPSQVVHTMPRGGTPGSAPPISVANLPPIALSPAPANRIRFAADTLSIPE